MEKNRIIKLSENNFKSLVENSIKQVLSEISWGKATDTSKKSDNRMDMLFDAWDNFETSANELVQALQGIDTRGYYVDYSDPQNMKTQGPKLGRELEALMDKIKTYIDRKHKQSINVKNKATKKFSDAFGGKTYDEVSNNINAKWDEYLGSDEPNWSDFRKKHLNKNEIEFDDRENGR